MRIPKSILAAGLAVLALIGVGTTLILADHENGEASNGGCDVFYWAAREPAEVMMGESANVTASTAATAQRVIALTAEVPCDGTQMITFNASAAAAQGTYLSAYARMTCQSGRCTESAPPTTGGTFARPAQVCAPGDNDEPPANRRGAVILSNPNGGDIRAGVSLVTFCGANAGTRGQISAGTYLIEVLAYQTDATGMAAGGGARFDERALGVELWGQAACFTPGQERSGIECGPRSPSR